MSTDEAEKVIAILLKADGGCPTCAKELVGKFGAEFPEYKEIAEQKYIKEFPSKEFLL
jgi:hypothetical protein